MERSSAGSCLEMQQLNQLFKMGQAQDPQERGQTRLKEIVARGVKHVVRLLENQLAQIAVIDTLADRGTAGGPGWEIGLR